MLTPLLWSYPEAEAASVRISGPSDREAERLRNGPTVSVSRLSELLLRDGRGGFKWENGLWPGD